MTLAGRGTSKRSLDLIDAARIILHEHEAAIAAGRSALEHARRCGDLLHQAKAAIPHGAWLPWLAEHCPMLPARTAQVYMRIAARWSAIEANTQRVADLPLREALALLADHDPRCPRLLPTGPG